MVMLVVFVLLHFLFTKPFYYLTHCELPTTTHLVTYRLDLILSIVKRRHYKQD